MVVVVEDVVNQVVVLNVVVGQVVVRKCPVETLNVLT